MLKSIFFFLLLFSFSVLGKTNNSLLIETAQNELYKNLTPYPVLIFDKDEIDWKFMQARAFGNNEGQASLREEIIKNYVKEKTGLEISQNDASNFELYLYQLKEIAVSLPISDSFGGEYKMCAVFPAGSNSNQRLEMERVLSLGTTEAYGEIKYHNIKNKMTYQNLTFFSLYHEIGHCLDRFYMPQTYQSGEDPSSVHLSESFAEVFSMLILAKKNIHNLGKNRSVIRTIYSQFMGNFFISHPENSYGNPYYAFGGIIYYLSPVIEYTQSFIDMNLEKIQTMTLPEILNLSQTIVKENALSSQVFQALHSAAVEGEDVVVERLKDYAERMPELFKKASLELTYYLKKIKSDLANAFDLDAIEEASSGQLDTIDYSTLCKLKNENSSEEFQRKIQTLRDELSNSLVDLSLLKERQNELRNLNENLNRTCDLHI